MSSRMIQDFAPAKINLYLHILGRREDGYHNLDSLTVFADIGDHLQISKSAHYSLEVTGPFAATLMADNSEPNLVLQAADVVSHCVKEIPPGGEITLEKNIPVSAGMGGGSSDAAALIRALLKLHNQKLSDIARQQIALAIGADVSVCLEAKAAQMTGAGHSVTPYGGLPAIYAVLVNPGIQVSTAAVFKKLDMAKGYRTGEDKLTLPKKFGTVEELCQCLVQTRNDLQQPAISQAPVIQDVLLEISRTQDCLLSRMTGSGASCFGLYSSQQQAEKAAEILQGQEPGWWVKAARLG